MALSLGWHIVVACLGVGFPLLVLLAEWRWIRTGDDTWRVLARRWAKGLAVVFAVGAVSGTILSFEMGILWPGLMGTFGEVIGLPFAIEGIAFFIEAIFLGIYLFAWDRLPPRAHLLSGIPIVLAGVASAFFVVTANAWMQQPQGFELVDGRVVDASPWEAMFNPATPHQTVHMILAAFMVSGFLVATVYAAALLRGKRDAYHRRAFRLAFAFAAIATPVQIGVGDWAARFLAERQPTKLAALEGLDETTKGAGLTVGGVYLDGEVYGGIEIPKLLSVLAFHDPSAEVEGLDAVPEEDRPPVGIVRNSFQAMVGIGTFLVLVSAWFLWARWRRRELPGSAWFLRAVIAAGPLAVVALIAGWITTEVGRQPWIVYEFMRTEEAVTGAEGIPIGYATLVVVYIALYAVAYVLLRRIGREGPEAELQKGAGIEALP